EELVRFKKINKKCIYIEKKQFVQYNRLLLN
ncbi:unnamed protein product, partial [Rotaria sordida]